MNRRVYAFGSGNLGIGKTSLFSKSIMQDTGPSPYILINLLVICFFKTLLKYLHAHTFF